MALLYWRLIEVAVRGWEEKCSIIPCPWAVIVTSVSQLSPPTPLGNTGRLGGLALGECLPPGWTGSGKIMFPGEWAFAEENNMSVFHNDNFPLALQELRGSLGGSWR